MNQADSNANENLSALEQAQKLLSEGQLEECLQIVKSHWLENPRDSQACALLARVMNEAGHGDLAEKLERLSGILHADNKTAATELFESSHALIDIRQHDLASMLLKRCLTEHPEEPVINYELGFSLMSLGKFAEALKCFEKASERESDFDTTLNLAVCYSLTRRIDDAKNALKKLEGLVGDDDEKKELAHRKTVLKRLEKMHNKSVFSYRDWLYILYGSILLNPTPVFGKETEDTKKIAWTMAHLKGLFQALRIEIETVEYYSTYSRPLTKILAELFGVTSDNYRGPNRPERALLVMSWASDIIGPHRSFMENNYQRILFAYGLPMEEPLPVTPDVVGTFMQQLTMPWSENVTKGSSTKDLVETIVQKAQALEYDPDFIRQLEEAVTYYDDRRELLVLGNDAFFPERPEYSAEVHQETAESK